MKFTALLHHLTVDLLRESFYSLKRKAAPGVDGLKEVFECRKLPRQGRQYISYQLLRNVLAAYALDLDFCVLLDARRPDLVEQWYRIMRCIRSMTLRTKCKVLTWQELAPCLPSALRQFLDAKYGIVPEGYS
jgi:hypothetical protein